MDQGEPAVRARLRAEGAAEEREAILALIERYIRYLSHGHGATGAQVLQEVLDEVRRRGEPGAGAR